jgi:hypothetical protein
LVCEDTTEKDQHICNMVGPRAPFRAASPPAFCTGFPHPLVGAGDQEGKAVGICSCNSSSPYAFMGCIGRTLYTSNPFTLIRFGEICTSKLTWVLRRTDMANTEFGLRQSGEGLSARFKVVGRSLTSRTCMAATWLTERRLMAT